MLEVIVYMCKGLSPRHWTEAADAAADGDDPAEGEAAEDEDEE